MELYTLQEAGDLLHLDARRMWTLCRKGIVPSVHVGRRAMVPADALKTWRREQARSALKRTREVQRAKAG